MDLDSLAEQLAAFARARNWEQFHTPRNLGMALAAEVGELLAELQWRSDEECEPTRLDAGLREKLADEAADVLIYLVQFANVCGIDLMTASLAKVGRNELRYPVHLARGSAAKYADLPGRDSALDSPPPTDTHRDDSG